MFNYRSKLQGLQEWYGRFRGRKFYDKVRKIYTRSNHISISDDTKKKYFKNMGDR